MIDLEYLSPQSTGGNEAPKIKVSEKKGRASEPKPAIPNAPANVDTSRITEASRAFAAQAVAKLFVLFTTLGAYISKAKPIAMTDEEAISVAIPLTTILLRIKYVQELFKD